MHPATAHWPPPAWLEARGRGDGRASSAALVGYQVRFQEKVGEHTAIKFMTDGILLAETQGDRDPAGSTTRIIIDEAHERSLNIDFLLGYLNRLRSSAARIFGW